eukprot:scaffold1982_cov93-Amphora_coffeaeformis.AAC.28
MTYLKDRCDIPWAVARYVFYTNIGIPSSFFTLPKKADLTTEVVVMKLGMQTRLGGNTVRYPTTPGSDRATLLSNRFMYEHHQIPKSCYCSSFFTAIIIWCQTGIRVLIR